MLVCYPGEKTTTFGTFVLYGRIVISSICLVEDVHAFPFLAQWNILIVQKIIRITVQILVLDF